MMNMRDIECTAAVQLFESLHTFFTRWYTLPSPTYGPRSVRHSGHVETKSETAISLQNAGISTPGWWDLRHDQHLADQLSSLRQVHRMKSTCVR